MEYFKWLIGGCKRVKQEVLDEWRMDHPECICHTIWVSDLTNTTKPPTLGTDVFTCHHCCHLRDEMLENDQFFHYLMKVKGQKDITKEIQALYYREKKCVRDLWDKYEIWSGAERCNRIRMNMLKYGEVEEGFRVVPGSQK